MSVEVCDNEIYTLTAGMYISLVHSKMLPECVYQIKILMSGISELCTSFLL